MIKKISVIIATKNRSSFLSGCLDSILQQSLIHQTEVLVIDKSHSDKDRKIVKKYKEVFPCLKYIRQQSSGLYAAWNMGIRKASGQYLINLNTDDRLQEKALENLSVALDKNPRYPLAYGNSLITKKPNESFEKNSSHGQMLDTPDFSHKELLLRCICGPHPMWRKNIHQELGFFDTKYKITADYEFWLRLAKKHPLLHINTTVGLYYKNPQGLASSRKLTEIKAKENINIKKKYLNALTVKH